MRAEESMDNQEEMAREYDQLISEERKNNFCMMFLKVFAMVLLVGAVYASLFSTWTPYDPKDSDAEVCDLSVGKWIPNPAGPTYTNETCGHIQPYTNCLKNGRPDKGYLYWKWKPSACNLPPFNPSLFLNKMRDKSWAFIGDSIFRNHAQSFICLLSRVEEPYDIYHDSTYSTRTWYYPSYNFTLYIIWSPFLVQNEISEFQGDAPQTRIHVHLDILDSKWTTIYHMFDYVVLSGSQWFYKSSIMIEDSKVIGCHNCPYGKIKELGVETPYRKALKLTFKFITTSDNKPFVFLRTWTPSHYENGDWPNERICNRSSPFKKGQIDGDLTDHKMRNIEVEEFKKAAAIGARNGVRIKLLDTYPISLLRPDGHPGPYKNFHPFDGKNENVENDCIHWCLPGPIDTWNDLLMKMVISGDVYDSISASSRI